MRLPYILDRIWDHISPLQPGDRVVARASISKIRGWGDIGSIIELYSDNVKEESLYLVNFDAGYKDFLYRNEFIRD